MAPTTIANHRQFDSFGNITSETNAAVDQLFGYTGRAFDESTGLQNNLNRWYDSTTGKWLSEDPIGFAGGDTNLGRYVGNSSLDSIDPLGLWDFWRWLYTGDGNAPDNVYYDALDAAGYDYDNNVALGVLEKRRTHGQRALCVVWASAAI